MSQVAKQILEKDTLIGKHVPKLDAPAKVSGRALYTTDIKLPNMLHAKILRSPYAHARVVRIETGQ
ncbi:MAG: hypothetical protein GY763_14980, partial [Gammaproteobacteria bacterium]|nr:hypothetical protein [Gammaproteobacteria bacterium]